MLSEYIWCLGCECHGKVLSCLPPDEVLWRKFEGFERLICKWLDHQCEKKPTDLGLACNKLQGHVVKYKFRFFPEIILCGITMSRCSLSCPCYGHIIANWCGTVVCVYTVWFTLIGMTREGWLHRDNRLWDVKWCQIKQCLFCRVDWNRKFLSQ